MGSGFARIGQVALRAAAVFLCAGCASVGAVTHLPASSHPATTASNQRAAIADARTLLAGVVPPSGAVARPREHVDVLTPIPASALTHRSWTVPGAPAAVLSFVLRHLPPGSSIESSGYGPASRFVIRSWPSVHGVLGIRWLRIDVGAVGHRTLLTAIAQVQWLITRPARDRIPAGVDEVDITDGPAGKAPLLKLRVREPSQVRALVALFDRLPLVQGGTMSCPMWPAGPTVTVTFRGHGGQRLARASVSANANLPWPPQSAAWECIPEQLSVPGADTIGLAGNVIAPMQHLLHMTLPTR